MCPCPAMSSCHSTALCCKLQARSGQLLSKHCHVADRELSHVSSSRSPPCKRATSTRHILRLRACRPSSTEYKKYSPMDTPPNLGLTHQRCLSDATVAFEQRVRCRLVAVDGVLYTDLIVSDRRSLRCWWCDWIILTPMIVNKWIFYSNLKPIWTRNRRCLT